MRNRHWGSHTSAAAKAGSAHKPTVSGIEPPEAWNTGTAISEPITDPADMLSR